MNDVPGLQGALEDRNVLFSIQELEDLLPAGSEVYVRADAPLRAGGWASLVYPHRVGLW